MRFDWRRFSTLDRVIAGCAVVALVALFLPWYGTTDPPFSSSVDGWSAGFPGWTGGLLLAAAGVLVVLRNSGVDLARMGVYPSVMVGGVATLGLVLVFVRWLTFPRSHIVGLGLRYETGATYGIYVALLSGIAEVVAAVMAMRASGERMPWAAPDS